LANVFATGALLIFTTSGLAGPNGTGKSSERKLTEAGEGTFEVLEAADQYAEARTAPADVVDPGAFSDAYLVAKNLPTFGGSWSEATTSDYNSDAHGYRDPVWSNSGGGAGLVSGRVTSLAVDGGILYAGTSGAAGPSSGLELLLPAFAAAFLGATTIRPGRFNAWGTLIAVYFLVTGITGLQLMGAESYVQNLFYGAALVLAVAFSQIVRRRRASRADVGAAP